MLPPGAILRVARPTNMGQLEDVVAFYRDGLGFEVLSRFGGADHHGFSGVMLGHCGAPYHLEFTAHPDHTVPRASTQDNLLVFYIPDAAAWRLAADRILALGHNPTPSFNPYWGEHGVTFEDPDGYRVVLQHGDWSK